MHNTVTRFAKLMMHSSIRLRAEPLLPGEEGRLKHQLGGLVDTKTLHSDCRLLEAGGWRRCRLGCAFMLFGPSNDPESRLCRRVCG